VAVSPKNEFTRQPKKQVEDLNKKNEEIEFRKLHFFDAQIPFFT
jgi:hypothetical protein